MLAFCFPVTCGRIVRFRPDESCALTDAEPESRSSCLVPPCFIILLKLLGDFPEPSTNGEIVPEMRSAGEFRCEVSGRISANSGDISLSRLSTQV